MAPPYGGATSYLYFLFQHEIAYIAAMYSLFIFLKRVTSIMIDAKFLDDIIQSVPTPSTEGGEETKVISDEPVKVKDGHVDIVIDVPSSQNPAPTQLQYAHQLVAQDIQALDNYVSALRLSVVNAAGMESFGHDLVNIFAGVFNSIGHVVNLFKTALLRGFKDFKRGEVNEWYDSNRATAFRINHANYDEVKDVVLDAPDGLKCTFYGATKATCAYMNKLQMRDAMKKMLDLAKRISNDINTSSNTNFSSYVFDIERSILSKDLPQLYKAKEKCLPETSKRAVRLPFGKLFDSMKEFADTADMLRDVDVHLREVATIWEGVQTLQKIFNGIYDDVNTHRVDIHKDAMLDLAKIAKAFAESISQFSICCNDIARLQHNYVLDLDVLRKELDM